MFNIVLEFNYFEAFEYYYHVRIVRNATNLLNPGAYKREFPWIASVYHAVLIAFHIHTASNTQMKNTKVNHFWLQIDSMKRGFCIWFPSNRCPLHKFVWWLYMCLAVYTYWKPVETATLDKNWCSHGKFIRIGLPSRKIL